MMDKIRKIIREELENVLSEQDDEVARKWRNKANVLTSVASYESGRLDKVVRMLRKADDVRPDEDLVIEAQSEIETVIENLRKALRRSKKDNINFD